MATKKATNAGSGRFCWICEEKGFQRLGSYVYGTDRETGERTTVCGFHYEALEDSAAWPIISNWANTKWVKEFERLLQQLERDELDDAKVVQDINSIVELGVRMKLDPKVLRRLDSYVVAGYTINRPEPAARYAHRVNSYLERFIVSQAKKIAKEQKARKESNDENV